MLFKGKKQNKRQSHLCGVTCSYKSDFNIHFVGHVYAWWSLIFINVTLNVINLSTKEINGERFERNQNCSHSTQYSQELY